MEKWFKTIETILVLSALLLVVLVMLSWLGFYVEVSNLEGKTVKVERAGSSPPKNR